MNRKKIIIVSAVFTPEITPRANRVTELAMEFARMGHDVVVYTKKKNYNHSDISKEYGIRVAYYGNQVLPDIVLKSNKIVFFITRAINKILNILFYYPYIEDTFLIPRALKKEEGYDLMISVAFPHSVHWGVTRIQSGRKKIANVWVADCGDPFMGNTLDIKRFFYFKFIEKWFCKKVDFITIPVESARNAYYPEFRNKIEVIPQGFKFNKLETSNNKNIVPTFLYAGLFIPGSRDPRLFLKYLLEKAMNFKFYIFTMQAELIDSYVIKSNGRVIVEKYIPRNDLLNFINQMDFVINLDNNIGEMLPSKLIDYAMTGKPILNIKSNIDPIVIDQFLSGNYENQFVINNLEQFNIENVASKFLNFLNRGQ
jgi:hypothetical protein